MSDVVDVGWDTHPMKSLRRYLGKIPHEVKLEVTDENEKWAQKLAVYIRAAAPGQGAHASTRTRARKNEGHGSRHRTEPGSLKASVRAKRSADQPTVVASGSKAPHVAVMEFGGSVWWVSHKGGGRRGFARAAMKNQIGRNQRVGHKSYKQLRGTSKLGHIIGVRKRSFEMDHFSMKDARGTFGGGAEGWWFYPTVREHTGAIVHDAVQAQQEAIKRALPRRIT